jgi:hypothetical protein
MYGLPIGTKGSSLNLRENFAQVVGSCGGGLIACMSSAETIGSGVYAAGIVGRCSFSWLVRSG